jgi:hypothetical protein
MTLLAGWATPAAREAGGTPEQFLDRKRKAVENGAQLGISLTSLSLQAQTASGWATPTASQKRRSEAFQEGRSLSPQEAFGQKPNGCHVGTERRGQLAPGFSLWLMGLPPEWESCAPLVTLSARRKPKPSSKP